MTGAYYNEIDPFAAAWLRELIKNGHIADGEVDERSIADVQPNDLVSFTQCHFFAGIGVWSHALRRAGWSDDRPAWTGSCPCQPFSAAGKQTGTDDIRHLWPVWFDLIRERRPPVVFGEQVEAAVNHGWLDLVQSDLEGEDYACGSVGFPACGIGAPHIRQRLWFVAESMEHAAGNGRQQWRTEPDGRSVARGCSLSGMADLHVDGRDQARGCQPAAGCDGIVGNGASDKLVNAGLEGLAGHGDDRHEPGRDGTVAPRSVAASGESCGLDDTMFAGRAEGRAIAGQRPPSGRGGPSGLANAEGSGCGLFNAEDDRMSHAPGDTFADAGDRAADGPRSGVSAAHRPGPTNGFWRDADWLGCRDGKWRPVEPGTFPLVNGASARVGRLRGYGNAINAEAAEAFITAYMDFRP